MDESNLAPTSSQSSAKIRKGQSPIYSLPNELLTKIIEKIPRTQWPALELVDPNLFLEATRLAWGSIRYVDIERDFIYSVSKAIEYNEDGENRSNTRRWRMRRDYVRETLYRQVARKTNSILVKLIERSPLITSLRVSLLVHSFFYTTADPYLDLNATAVQYLSHFEHLETIKFAEHTFPGRIGNDVFNLSGGIPLINLAEFIESTQSRSKLKEISIAGCNISDEDIEYGRVDLLRAAFANDSNDPSRRLLKMGSFTSGFTGDFDEMPDFLGAIDSSRMTRLSFARDLPVDSALLTTLVNGAPQLCHLDFSFVQTCSTECNGERLHWNVQLLAALESHRNLTSLGFNDIWQESNDCACMQFEVAFLKMLNTIGPRLEKFAFYSEFLPSDIRTSDTGMFGIIRNRMHRLKAIDVSTDPSEECSLDPADVRGIADFKELERIKIDIKIEHVFNDDTIMDDVLSTIISKSSRLKRFVASNYRPDQRVVAEICKLGNLVDLQISGITLTEKGFIVFSQASFVAKLEVLNLGDIDEGVESGLIELVSKAKQLRQLTVHRNVSDQLLKCLVESCPNLERFNAMNLTNGITIDAVQTLVDRCSMLRRLNVGNQLFTVNDLKIEKYRKPLHSL